MSASFTVGPGKITLVYASLSVLWITTSDWMVAQLTTTSEQFEFLSTIKGWLFVALSGAILYNLMQHMLYAIAEKHAAAVEALAERSRALNLLGAISEQSSDAIFVKDVNGRYLLFNPAAARAVGQKSDDVVGRDDFALFPPDEAQALMDFERHLMSEGSVRTLEETMSTPQGTRTFLSTKGALSDENGGCVGVFGISRDITERKQVETELATAKVAVEKASEAKSRFFAAASHDLRQPFQAMRLFYEVLANNITNPRDREALELLGRSMRSTESLLNEMLDVTKIDGLIHLNMRKIAPANVIREVANELELVAADKNLKMRAVTRDDVEVITEPMLLRRVLSNLVGNAVRYTETGGVLIAMRRRPGQSVIEVWDTGVGIAPEVQDLVFEEFYQVGNTARDRTKGLGLGLAITTRLCNHLGYHLSLASRLGKGSVFRVAIPLDKI